MLKFETYCEDFDPDFPARVFFVVFEEDEPSLVFSTTHNLRDVVKAIDEAKNTGDLVKAGYEPTNNWEDEYGNAASAEEVYNEMTSVDVEYYHMVIDRARHFCFINASKALIEEFLPEFDPCIPKACYEAEPSVYKHGVGPIRTERVVTTLCGKPAKVKLCGDWLSWTDLGDAYRKEMVRLSSEYLGELKDVVRFDDAYACFTADSPYPRAYAMLSPEEMATLVDFYALIRGYADVSEKERTELLRKANKVFCSVGTKDAGHLLINFTRGIPAGTTRKE